MFLAINIHWALTTARNCSRFWRYNGELKKQRFCSETYIPVGATDKWIICLVQFNLVAPSCPTLCHPMDTKSSMPGFSAHHYLPELTQTHVHRVGDAIQPSHPLSSPFSSRFQSFPASGSFQKSHFFASGGQSIGVSVLASVLPMNIQDWFPLG